MVYMLFFFKKKIIDILNTFVYFIFLKKLIKFTSQIHVIFLN